METGLREERNPFRHTHTHTHTHSLKNVWWLRCLWQQRVHQWKVYREAIHSCIRSHMHACSHWSISSESVFKAIHHPWDCTVCWLDTGQWSKGVDYAHWPSASLQVSGIFLKEACDPIWHLGFWGSFPKDTPFCHLALRASMARIHIHERT